MRTIHNLKERAAAAAVCSVCLMFALPNVPKLASSYSPAAKCVAEYLYGGNINAEQVLGVLSAIGISFAVCTSPIRSSLLLYLIFGSQRLPVFIYSNSFGALLSILLHSTGNLNLSCVFLPALGSGYGAVLLLCTKRRSVLPLFLSLMFSLSIFALSHTSLNAPESTAPLTTSSVIYPNSKGVYIAVGQSTYGKYNGKQGSGDRTVFGVDVPQGWVVVPEDPDESSYAPSVLTSGAVVHLQSLSSGEFLQTQDVASPLTYTHQEVSCTDQPGPLTKFLLLGIGGEDSLGLPIQANAPFFIKHVETGVFLTVLKRRRKEGFEINGEKQTGRNTFRGSDLSVWRSSSSRPFISSFSLRKFAVKIANIFEDAKKEALRAVRQPREFPPGNSFVFSLFSVSLVRSVFSSSVKPLLFSALLDLAAALLFNSNVPTAVFSIGVCSISEISMSSVKMG